MKLNPTLYLKKFISGNEFISALVNLLESQDIMRYKLLTISYWHIF